MNEKISLLRNRKSDVTEGNKYSFKIYFHEMEKLFPLDGIFEKLEPNAFL